MTLDLRFQGRNPRTSCCLILPKAHNAPDLEGTQPPPLTLSLVPRTQLDTLLGHSFATNTWVHIGFGTCSTQDRTFYCYRLTVFEG